MAFLAFLFGVAAGGGAVMWWQAPPAPAPFRADEHAVELLLFEAVPPPTLRSEWESKNSPLQVDSAFLLSGAVTSTVLTISNSDQSFDVRVPALPVTVSPTARLQLVKLKIIVRDCEGATRWTPVDRPFTIAWRDEYGKRHLDRAGDFDKSMASSLIHYIDALCGNAPRGLARRPGHGATRARPTATAVIRSYQIRPFVILPPLLAHGK